ncbi:proline-rich transmembrane protein 3 [Rhinophrynus dorsalis]
MEEAALFHMWIILATFLFSEPSIALSEVDNITDTEPKHGLTEENLWNNYSEEPSKNDLKVQKIDVSKDFPFEGSISLKDLSHTKPPGERLGSFPITAAFVQGERSIENLNDHIENSSNDFLNKEVENILPANLQNSNKMGQIRPVTTSRPSSAETLNGHFVLNVNPSRSGISELRLKPKSPNLASKDEKGTKPQSTKERSSSYTINEPLHMENYVERENRKDILSTLYPTVSTIALLSTTPLSIYTGENSPITQIQRLQIASVNDNISKDQLKKTLEDQGDFLDNVSPVTSKDLRQAAENNFVDDNLISKVNVLQPSEKYHAAHGTTESYSGIHDRGPEGNEVISADVELLHTDDNIQYQKDSNTILEEPTAVENKTDAPHFSPFLQHKQKTGTDDQIHGLHTSSNKHLTHFLPSTPSLKQEDPTLLPFLNKTNIPFDTIYLNKHITLEAKSRTQTERISPSSTFHKSFIIEKDETVMATDRILPHLSDNTDSRDHLLSSVQPHETPTPAMQVLGKTADKLQEVKQNSTQLGNGYSKPAITQKNATVGSSPPRLEMTTSWKILVTRQQDLVPGTKPPQTEYNATSQVLMNGTKRYGRRGEIRVTTQRALQRPRLIEAPTSLPSRKPTMDASLCTKAGGTCEFLGFNRTLLKWDDLQRTLSFAWDMHVYGTGSLFLLLSVIAIINLIGSPIVRVPYLPYILASNGLLFIIGVLRGVYFLLDPYGTKSKISHGVALVFYNVTFPLMLSAFATLVLLVLKIACLQLLPPNLQSLPLLAVVGVIHFIILLSADLLTHLLNPSVNIVLQILSISWGVFLMVGNFGAYYRLRRNSKDVGSDRVSPTSEDIVAVQTQERNIKCLFTTSRVLLVSSIFGLLCCGLQVYAVLWLYGLLGKKNEFTWSWWFLQFWFRIFELALCFSMLFVASHSFCQQCSRSDHTCWSKIISYFCNYNKTEVPEYPNNCYDWTNSIQERVVNNNISKSIIRNQPENMLLKVLKENNEAKSNSALCNNTTSSSPLYKPKPDSVFGPKSQNVTMGRSYTSICFEKESMLSLTDLEFRPPSPINLSRSIDEALFREHLVRDSIFLDSSLQYPSYLSRQDSCSSLKECSALNQTVDPLITSDLKMRRCSNPDYMYSLARCSSPTEVDSQSESLQQSKDLPRDVTTEAAASVSSLDSVSKGSIKISWNPWRHGLSSVESLPLEDAPSTQLLKQGSQPSIPSKGSEHEKIFGKRLIERSQTTDSHSIASDTIEL